MKNITKYALALLIVNCSLLIEVNAQVAINEDNANPNASAMLDISSTDKGLLIPRMTSDQRTMIANPETGLLVFDTDSTNFQFYNGTEWMALLADTLSVIADSDNDTKIQVEKNEDEDIIRFDLGGTEFMQLDNGRIEILNTGRSIFLGNGAGANDNFNRQNTHNVFIGDSTGYNNTTGYENIYLGYESGYSGIDARLNTFIGYQAGFHNKDHGNTFIGHRSGYFNTEGSNNVFIGLQSGRNNTDGEDNVFIGRSAGYNNTTGQYNAFMGRSAGYSNTTGEYNTFTGRSAGYDNTTGCANVFLGRNTGANNTTADKNTFIGTEAGYSNTIGANSVLIGYQAGYYETDSSKLYIENSNSTSPLIYGDFATDYLQINGKLNINGIYELPITDGTANQVLTTNGNGTVSWSDNMNTDDQTIDVFSLSGDNLQLSLESDGQSTKTVSLSSLKDNLGNHTASQNIQLNNNWLSNDGGNEGVRIDNNGQVGIGTSSPNALLDLSDGSGNNDVLLRFNTERPWQFEEQGSGANTNLVLKSSSTGKNFNMLSSDGSTIASFRALNGNGSKMGINKTIGTNDNTLEVNGTASKSTAGDWLANSDARLKKNIKPLESQVILNKLLDLQGVTYEWNDDKTGNERPEGIQYGFTAQNIQAVFPTLVTEDSKGYLQTAYGTYDAMYVEALRALAMENEKQNAEIEQLKIENGELKTQVSEIQQLKVQNAEMKAMLEQIQAQLNNNSDSINTGVSAEK